MWRFVQLITCVVFLATAQAKPPTSFQGPTVPMDSDARADLDRRISRHAEESRDRQKNSAIVASSEQFRVIRQDLLVDVPNGRAIFNLWFSEMPDLELIDEFGRQSHSFQYFVDQPDFGSFYDRSAGTDGRVQPLLIIRGEEVHYDGEVVVREVEPFYAASSDPASGGWGPTIATGAFQQDKKRISFRVPLAVFDDVENPRPYANPGFAVHYFLELYRYGSSTGANVVQGIARVGTVGAEIKFKPYNFKNVIRLGDPRLLLVDVLTILPNSGAPETFFADAVDVRTLMMGPRQARPKRTQLSDLNGDGYMDLRIVFKTSDLGLGCIDSDVQLTGEVNLNGLRQVFVGSDTVQVVGCP